MYKSLENVFKEERELKEDLSEKTLEVYNTIVESWPINPTGIAENLGEEVHSENRKSTSSKYLYHVKKLFEKDLIHMKKVGNTYIAWPKEIEKLRMIRELVS